MKKGKFLTCEGPDGSSKSTNLPYVKEALEAAGYTVVVTREPGGTPLGEKIRELLLDNNNTMAPMTELLLFAAQRAEHIAKKIRPALDAGYIVLCDRFADSTYAYQGSGRGYKTSVLALEQLVHEGFEPDYTLFFTVDMVESERRIAKRMGKDRLDGETLDFKTATYRGYMERYYEHIHRMHPINSMQSFEDVRADVEKWVREVFIPANPLE